MQPKCSQVYRSCPHGDEPDAEATAAIVLPEEAPEPETARPAAEEDPRSSPQTPCFARQEADTPGAPPRLSPCASQIRSARVILYVAIHSIGFPELRLPPLMHIGSKC